MAPCFQWKRFLCCLWKRKSRSNEHKFCGCVESRKQGLKMKIRRRSRRTSADENENRSRPMVDDEAVDVLEYDFIPEAEWSIKEPEIPFCHEFTKRLRPQFDIIIQGTVHSKAFRFAVNLESKSYNERKDILFHFNPRLDQRYSACNSLFEGKWGREEHSSQQKFPFKWGEKFFLEIFLTHSEFLVAVNGVQYTKFKYRAPLLEITSITIEGGVILSSVNFLYTSFYPCTLPVDYPPSPYRFALPEGLTQYEHRLTPIYGNLLEKLKPGSSIEINGQVELLPHAFYFNLQEGSHIFPHPEIPFHISVRFINGIDEIRTNSWLTSTWGKEQLVNKCIFTPGYKFTLVISCTENEFIAQVNDQPQLTYKHRVPYTNIDTLHIQGDVLIYDIKIHL